MAVHRQVGGSKAFALELFEGVQYSVMLHLAGDDVIAAPPVPLGEGGATNRRVVRLGAAAREYDLFGSRTEQVGNQFSRRIERAMGFLPFDSITRE